ncbi:type II toxin-antitoxin system RelE/ParE family toxin [Stenotrophomonas sp. 278]|uniref:type II toxin-antitoxin system RelE/ParE family toxin n=1 Tax=Stenotrophomonas sp. 278 TaxID=2479851 RepID=UPI000F66372E|nr:type II toxin-antitoxin system RelE/ParE family toxin [Stenotrophomonas sp. 278]RRU12521.1 type II toxin-antitoxin system RelE/ParE family toxin [Stenotrophomonas sp. 278]
MKVQWVPSARQDRYDIWQSISSNSPSAAILMDELFAHAAAKLAEFPMIGRAGRVSGTREWVVHESYRVVYQIAEEAGIVWILALVHTARQWPPKSS